MANPRLSKSLLWSNTGQKHGLFLSREGGQSSQVPTCSLRKAQSTTWQHGHQHIPILSRAELKPMRFEGAQRSLLKDQALEAWSIIGSSSSLLLFPPCCLSEKQLRNSSVTGQLAGSKSAEYKDDFHFHWATLFFSLNISGELDSWLLLWC